MRKKRRNGRAPTETSVVDEIVHLRGLDLKGLRARWQSSERTFVSLVMYTQSPGATYWQAGPIWSRARSLLVRNERLSLTSWTLSNDTFHDWDPSRRSDGVRAMHFG